MYLHLQVAAHFSLALARPSLEGRGSGDTAIVDLCSLANFFRGDKWLLTTVYITLHNIT